MSPSGTSQDTVAESARRCMTETLTGAGGRSEGKKTETEGSGNPPTRYQIIHVICAHTAPGASQVLYCISITNSPQLRLAFLTVNV